MKISKSLLVTFLKDLTIYVKTKCNYEKLDSKIYETYRTIKNKNSLTELVKKLLSKIFQKLK